MRVPFSIACATRLLHRYARIRRCLFQPAAVLLLRMKCVMCICSIQPQVFLKPTRRPRGGQMTISNPR